MSIGAVEHRGSKRGERCRFDERKYSIFDTLHPNRFAQQEFSCQTIVQQDFGILKKIETLQTSV
jgi:hypothetical protein